MKLKSKKIISLLFLVIVTTSFSGCINLSKSPATPSSQKNDHQGVFKSVDGGKTWEHKVKIEGSEEMLDKIKIASMEMDPQDNKVLFLGTIGNGLYKSENGADSWKKNVDENDILSETATINDIAIEKNNPNIIYLAGLNNGRGSLLKSEDGGKSWSESYITAEENKTVNRVEIDPIYRNIVYIGTEQGGLIKSEDRGKNWYALSWFKNGVKDFVIDFKNNKGIVVRTTNEILKSVVGNNDETFKSMGGKEGDIFESPEGSRWMKLNKIMISSLSLKISYPDISSMTIDNQDPLTIYVTYSNLVLRTKDGGYSWEKLNTITPSLTAVGTIPQIKQIGMTDNIIYYGAGNVLYKSSNKGLSWSSYDIPIKGDVRYAVSDYSDSNVIYVGSFYEVPKKKR